MATLSSPGVGSGLDINGLVSKLMAVEKQPLTALDKKEADYQAKLTAYGTLKGALSSFQTSMSTLASPTLFSTLKGSVADTTIASISTNSIAKAASYQLAVTKLAQSQKLSSGQISDPTASIGTGTLTLDFGTYDSGGNTFTENTAKTAKTITIDSTHSSLNGVRDAINAAGAGVTASIVNDGTAYRLVISSNDSGAANSVRLLVDEGTGGTNTDLSGLSQFAYDPEATGVAPNGKNMTQSTAAQNAEFTIDGIAMTKTSNTVSDAISGVTLNLLKKTDTGVTTTVTVARDPTNVTTAVEGMVKAYNDLASSIDSLGGYDASTKKGGTLLGDSTLLSIERTMRQAMTKQLSGTSNAGVSSLSDIGIAFQRDGTLKLDSSKLSTVLADSTKNVGMLFATVGAASDSLVTYVGAGTSTATGNYGVEVTQVAQKASISGNVDNSSVTIDGTNNSLSLLVDSIAMDLTIPSGSYTAATLAAKLQTLINANSGLQVLGKSVTVSQSSGLLTIASNQYGASSSISLTGGNALAALFGTVTSVTGQDVAGYIGGTLATGSGQTLTANGAAAGLQLLVDGGVTGARGTVSFTHGIADQLKTAIQNMLDTDGTIANKTDSISSSIKSIDKQRTALESRLTDIEARYKKQFTNLDTMVAQMQQTSSYLTQQLASLSSSTSTK